MWNIINEKLKGLGENESERINNIIMSYLSHNGYFINLDGYQEITHIHEKIDAGEEMFECLIELLEEKGIIKHFEYTKRMERKIMEIILILKNIINIDFRLYQR